MRDRIQADPQDFQPALVRVQGTPPNPLGRHVLWVTLAFFAALLVWAIFGKLDIVAVADGKLIPDTYVKIVQPADSGVVKEILVKEGENVKAGQVLMRMDAALSDSDLKALTADNNNKRMALRRIDAQLGAKPFMQRSGDNADLFAQVHAQYVANRQAYDSALAQETSLLDKAKHELKTAEAVQVKLTQVLPHYREQEAAYEKLARDGFMGRIMYTDKQRERIEREQDLRAQESVIASAQATITQEEKKIAQITADYRRQLQTERVEVAAQLERLAQDLAKQAHRHEYLELRAPQDGVVKDLATHTIGTVTGPGTIMMTLVPKDEILRAEVWIKNDDIGFVRAAQRARIKLAAFTFQKYGMLEGKVAYVSADSAEQAASSGQAQTKAAAALSYKAFVDLTSQFRQVDGERHPLPSAMQVSAEIHLGTRTVLEYLLSPVTKAFHESARER